MLCFAMTGERSCVGVCISYAGAAELPAAPGRPRTHSAVGRGTSCRGALGAGLGVRQMRAPALPRRNRERGIAWRRRANVPPTDRRTAHTRGQTATQSGPHTAAAWPRPLSCVRAAGSSSTPAPHPTLSCMCALRSSGVPPPGPSCTSGRTMCPHLSAPRCCVLTLPRPPPRPWQVAALATLGCGANGRHGGGHNDITRERDRCWACGHAPHNARRHRSIRPPCGCAPVSQRAPTRVPRRAGA